jgi:alpha-tubulin suppressor-like RCC1 family protein
VSEEHLTFTQISMTAEHALALADDGTVWDRATIRAGRYPGPDRFHSPAAYPTPSQIPVPGAVRHVATGSDSSLLVTIAGSVYAWGRDLARESNTIRC